MSKYYIGIDLGTSSVKLLLMKVKDGEVSIERTVSREYPLSFPHPGWSEQNPSDWLNETSEGMKELMKGLAPESVRALSFGGQMHGLVALDEHDEVIRPAILWNDGRCQHEVEFLNGQELRQTIIDETGNIAFAGFTAPKLLWMREHEPENFNRIRKICLPKDYLLLKFTGVHATDVSDASGTLLFDVKNRCWSEKMLEICGLKEEQMPAVFESSERVGNLTEEAAEMLGLTTDCIVAAGAGDNAAAAIGSGIVSDGDCNISLGTSGTLFLASDRFVNPDNHAIHSFAHANGGYHLMGCMLSAASCNKWWMDEILKDKDYGKAQENIQESHLGRNTVLYLPYLMGERSPHNDPAARAMFFGMSMDTTREDMTQAVLEGVAFGLRDSLEIARCLGITPKKSGMVGGGAKSPLWRKIVANVFNMTIEVPETEEGPSFGACLLAATADGTFKTTEEAAKAAVKIKLHEEPDEELVTLYEGRYKLYKSLYSCVKTVYNDLQKGN